MDEKSRRFLDAAVSRGLITEADAEACERIWTTVREVGVEQEIGDILIKKDFLTSDQVRQLSRELSGMRVGKYEILEKLGEGGAGIVYRANQEPLDRIVAIKVLSSHRAQEKDYLERFRREARIAVTLNHLNIVRGLDYGHSDGYHYFVMEYVEGDSLFEILTREGVLDEKRALDIALQTVRALEHAFEFDLVHRDIKPENIMVTAEGISKLCDLGLAKPSLVESARSSKEGSTIGTPTYMSPEQIRGKDDADFRSDIYSLGVTLYHMLAGTPPFVGDTADIVVRKHVREEPLDPREHNLKLSNGVVSVVLKMLAKKPEDRYPSLGSLAEDFQAVLDGRPPRHTIQLGAPRATGKVRVDVEEGATRRTRIVEGKKRSPVLIVVIIAVLAAIGGAIVVLKPFGGGKKPPEPGPEVAGDPDPAPGTTPEERAEEAFREAATFEEQNPDASHEALVDQYDLVVQQYPRTRYGLRAKDRLRELEADRLARVEEKAKALRAAFTAAMSSAGKLVEAGRARDAAEALATPPEELSGTEYPDRMSRERTRILAEAEKKADEALGESDSSMRMGQFEKAIEELEVLAPFGIADIEARVEKKVEEIRAVEEQESRAREQGRELFRSVVGAAWQKAAVGQYREAEDDLVRASDRPKLAYFRSHLDQAWKDLREASRFDEALVAGADKVAGRVERFEVLTKGRSEVAGKVLGGTADGVRLARGTGEQLIRFVDLETVGLTRLAFEVLDANKGEDHGAAAMYFVARGRMDAATREIEAAKILGVDPEPLLERRDLIKAHLEDRADVAIRKAEVLSAQERFAEAAETLAGAAAVAPWYPRTRRLLGVALLKADRADEAVAELLLALELGEDDQATPYFLAEAHLAAGSPEPALTAYERYLSLAGSDGEWSSRVRERIVEIRDVVLKDRIKALSDEARDAYRKGDWELAIEKYARVFELSPKEEEALYWIGKAHVENGDVFQGFIFLSDFMEREASGRRASDAKRSIRTLLKLHRDGIECLALIQRGTTAFDDVNYKSALGLFDQAVAAGQLSSDAYYYRGRTHLRIGETTQNEVDFESALDDYDRAILLSPADMLASEGRALTLYYLKRYDEALEEAERTITGDPTRWGSFNVAGLVHLIRKDYDKAEELLNRGLKAAADEPTLYINRALAHEGRQRYRDAIADLEVAVKKGAKPNQRVEIERIFERIAKATEND